MNQKSIWNEKQGTITLNGETCRGAGAAIVAPPGDSLSH